MKNVFFALTLCLFSITTFAQAPVKPHAEFNDCNSDIITAAFDAKTSILTVTVETKQDLVMEKFTKLSMNWSYEVSKTTNSDVLFGWMNRHYQHQSENETAWAAWNHSDDSTASCEAGIIIPVTSIKTTKIAGKTEYQILLTKEQVQHLSDARALGGSISAFDFTRMWFKS